MFTNAPYIVKKKIQKSRFLVKVHAFCEEMGLISLLGILWYAESKNQCWQAEQWRFYCLICIFPKMAAKLKNNDHDKTAIYLLQQCNLHLCLSKQKWDHNLFRGYN